MWTAEQGGAMVLVAGASHLWWRRRQITLRNFWIGEGEK
jgi:hypothetical protein